MTPYEQGFMAKCAEYGIGPFMAGYMFKIAAREDWDALSVADKQNMKAQQEARRKWTGEHNIVQKGPLDLSSAGVAGSNMNELAALRSGGTYTPPAATPDPAPATAPTPAPATAPNPPAAPTTTPATSPNPPAAPTTTPAATPTTTATKPTPTTTTAAAPNSTAAPNPTAAPNTAATPNPTAAPNTAATPATAATTKATGSGARPASAAQSAGTTTNNAATSPSSLVTPPTSGTPKSQPAVYTGPYTQEYYRQSNLEAQRQYDAEREQQRQQQQASRPPAPQNARELYNSAAPEQKAAFKNWINQAGYRDMFNAMFSDTADRDKWIMENPEFVTGSDEDRKHAIRRAVHRMSPEQRSAFKSTDHYQRYSGAAWGVGRYAAPRNPMNLDGTYKTGPVTFVQNGVTHTVNNNASSIDAAKILNENRNVPGAFGNPQRTQPRRVAAAGAQRQSASPMYGGGGAVYPSQSAPVRPYQARRPQRAYEIKDNERTFMGPTPVGRGRRYG